MSKAIHLEKMQLATRLLFNDADCRTGSRRVQPAGGPDGLPQYRLGPGFRLGNSRWKHGRRMDRHRRRVRRYDPGAGERDRAAPGLVDAAEQPVARRRQVTVRTACTSTSSAGAWTTTSRTPT